MGKKNAAITRRLAREHRNRVARHYTQNERNTPKRKPVAVDRYNQLVEHYGKDYTSKYFTAGNIDLEASSIGIQTEPKQVIVRKRGPVKPQKVSATHKKTRSEIMDSRAEVLNIIVPKSEQWFRHLYESQDLKHTNDFYNKPFKNTYIPDVINPKYKYIIEIDGSIHGSPEQQEIDARKDVFYKKNRYKVYRLRHLDVIGYIRIIRLILKLRSQQETYKFKTFVEGFNKLV